jgi:hypothetical protein
MDNEQPPPPASNPPEAPDAEKMEQVRMKLLKTFP